MVNISQQNRQKMLEFLKELRKNYKEDEQLQIIGEIETALNEKKYGLVWEKHEEKVKEMLKEKIPVFIEDTSKKIFLEDSVHGGGTTFS